MSDPQTWTLIGVFATSSVGMLTVVSTMFVRTVQSEFKAMRAEMSSKFDVLDRDVQAIARRVFPE